MIVTPQLKTELTEIAHRQKVSTIIIEIATDKTYKINAFSKPTGN